MPGIRVTVDSQVQAAYIHIREGRIARTQQVTELVFVDVDSDGNALGVELLSLNSPIPFDKIEHDCRIPSDVMAVWGQIGSVLPAYSKMNVTTASDGTSQPEHVIRAKSDPEFA